MKKHFFKKSLMLLLFAVFAFNFNGMAAVYNLTATNGNASTPQITLTTTTDGNGYYTVVIETPYIMNDWYVASWTHTYQNTPLPNTEVNKQFAITDLPYVTYTKVNSNKVTSVVYSPSKAIVPYNAIVIQVPGNSVAGILGDLVNYDWPPTITWTLASPPTAPTMGTALHDASSITHNSVLVSVTSSNPSVTTYLYSINGAAAVPVTADSYGKILVTGLTPSTNYDGTVNYIEVWAVNSVGTSANSVKVDNFSTIAAPQPPTVTAASQASPKHYNSALVDVQATGTVNKFYVTTVSGCASGLVEVPLISGTSANGQIKLSGLSSSTTQNYYIVAENSVGNSNCFGPVSVKTTAAPADPLCAGQILSNTSAVTVKLTVQTTGTNQYEMKIESDYVMTSVYGSGFVDISSGRITLSSVQAPPSSDGKTIIMAFTSTTIPTNLHGDLSINFATEGFQTYSWPTVVWTTTCNAPPADLNLFDLLVDNATVVGFSPSQLTYNVVLPYGASLPVVDAVPVETDTDIVEMVINQAVSVEPGTATVVLTDVENPTNTKTYTINFSVMRVPVTVKLLRNIKDPGDNTNPATVRYTSNIYLVNEVAEFRVKVLDQHGVLMTDAVIDYTVSPNQNYTTANGTLDTVKTIKFTAVGYYELSVTASKGGVSATSGTIDYQVVNLTEIQKSGMSVFYTSSQEGSSAGTNTINGNRLAGGTWASAFSKGVNSNEYIIIDLGAVYNLQMVEVCWERAAAKTYTIEGCLTSGGTYTVFGGENYTGTATQWNHIYRQLINTQNAVRYLKINCTKAVSGYGNQIFEISAWGYKLPLAVAGTFNGWTQQPMNRIGNTDVYKLTIPFSSPSPAPSQGGSRAPVTYEYKVVKDGTLWPGNSCTGCPPGSNNRKFTTDANEVTFYAKVIGNNWYFVCDAQDIWLVGNVTGGSFDQNWKLLDQKTDAAVYYTMYIPNADVGAYMLKTHDTGSNLFPDDIMNWTQNIQYEGKYQITFYYETFEVKAQRLVEWVGNSLVYKGEDAGNTEYYNTAAHFNTPKDFGIVDVAYPFYIGGETQTYPRVDDGIYVAMYYQIDDKTPVRVPLNYWYDSGNNTYWRNWNGVNIFENIELLAGIHYLKVWYVAETANTKEYDSNNNNNYTAIFTTTQDIHLDLDETLAQKFIIYPNPATDIIYIYGISGAKDIRIFDVTGKTLISHSSLLNSNQIDVSSLIKGVYFIKVDNQVVKFIKK